MANYFIDLVGGSDAANGTAAVTPKKTIAALPTLAAGDLVKVKASPLPTLVAGNAMATWNDLAKSVAVTWTTQQVKLIDDCSIAWTAGSQGGGVTASASPYKKATSSSTLSVNPTGAIGMLMYRSLGSVVDFSAYQQVSFWIRVNGAQTAGSSRMSLRLCSDTAGTVTVNTIPIPAITANGRWTLVTVDAGGNLGGNIQSVALYADQTIPAVVIWLDNIIACKNSADALTLTSLISKGTANETYYGIQSISNISSTGCTIWLDNQTETLGGAGRGYAAQVSGLNETLPLWKREPLTYSQMGVALGTTLLSTTVAGTGAAPVRYEFGYANLSDATPTGETWVDAQNGAPNVAVIGGRYNNLSGLAVVRAGTGITISSNMRGCVVSSPACNNNNNGLSVSPSGSISVSINAASNNGNLGISSSTLRKCVFAVGQANNNSSQGVAVGTDELWAPLNGLFHCNNNLNGSILFNGSGSTIKRAQAWSGGTAINLATGAGNSFIDSKVGNVGSANPAIGQIVTSLNHNQVSGAHTIFSESAIVTAVQDANRRTLSGSAWKCNFTTSNLQRDQYFPLPLRLSRIACIAGRTVTATAWMKRDSLLIIGQLIVTGGDIAGVVSDVVSSMSGVVNTYEPVSVSFTPTESGVVDLIWNLYTSSNNVNVWIDDVIIKGAATTREVNTLDISDRGGLLAANSNGSATATLGMAWNDAQIGETLRATLPLAEAPDATPTCGLYKNGVIVAGASITVTALGSNMYAVSTQILSSNYAAGDSYSLIVSWTISGDAYSQLVAQGNVRGALAIDATGRVTVGTNADKGGYALSGAGIQALWDNPLSAIYAVGGIGAKLKLWFATLGADNKVILSSDAQTGVVIPTISALTGHTPQSGDAFARLGMPTLSSIAADITAVPLSVWNVSQNASFLPNTQGLKFKNWTLGSDGRALISGDAHPSGAMVYLNANAVNVSALATDAVNEIQSGLATGTAIAAIAAKTANIPANPATEGNVTAVGQAVALLRTDVQAIDGGLTDNEKEQLGFIYHKFDAALTPEQPGAIIPASTDGQKNWVQVETAPFIGVGLKPGVIVTLKLADSKTKSVVIGGKWRPDQREFSGITEIHTDSDGTQRTYVNLLIWNNATLTTAKLSPVYDLVMVGTSGVKLQAPVTDCRAETLKLG